MTRNLFDVIVVDDDRLMRDTIAETLKADGYFAVVAASSQAVFDLLKEKPWDLIISDIVRPGMDGLEMLRAIRATGDEIPIIILSAVASIETAVDAMKAGATDFLLKPVYPQQLLTAVRSALSIAALSDEDKIVYPVWPTKQ
jgi:DNA-binding NtrC family response regulator